MQWLNEPQHWEAGDGTLRFAAGAATDFWRKTHNDSIVDNGHFYYEVVSGDFEAEVRVSGQYGALYDQAGLMVRLDETIWLKTGIEFMYGVQHASAVVTRDYSDWSIVPLSPSPEAIYMHLKRAGGTFEIQYSVDSFSFSMIRQAHLTTAHSVQVGMMAAAPQGAGFEVAFDGFRIQSS
ncbi:MAG: hypothetical protein CL610_22735 [Anaerolineaceae bacterium]|nr:hypothetical protein [Anaerolineaceae bacterium]